LQERPHFPKVAECNQVEWVECQEWVGHHLAVDRYLEDNNNQ
jgi:hypothetical protein